VTPQAPEAAIGYAVLAALLAIPAWRWVRAGGHRRDSDDSSVEVPTALWLVPLAAIVGGVLGWVHGGSVALALVLVVVSVVLLVLCAVDLDVHRLPDKLTGFTFVLALVGLTVVALVSGDWESWRRALLASLALGALYVALVLIGRGSGMGLGDAKLSPSLGLMLGHLSWGAVFVATMATFLIGGLVATWLVVARGASRSTHLAFGPAMVGGAVLVWCLPSLPRLLPW
jgi:leader peptidase (prepilin peptidase)/N-methyltransferase